MVIKNKKRRTAPRRVVKKGTKKKQYRRKTTKRKGRRKTTTKRKARRKTTTKKRTTKTRRKTATKRKARRKTTTKKRTTNARRKTTTKKRTTKAHRKTTTKKRTTNNLVRRFCDNQSKKIELPTLNFMKKNGKYRFAYTVLLFPDPKSKQDKYMDGCIGVALGLRRQNVMADIICMCTPDVSKKTKDILKIVYDKVITVPYIMPHPKSIEVGRKAYQFVFTKFWILNKKIFPYEKVCLIDSDIVPIKYYDTLFKLNTPAGIIEPPRDKQGYNPGTAFKKYRCNSDFTHGKKVKKNYTDLWNKESGDSNAGLWVLKPDTNEFNSIMKEIKSDPKNWIGPNKKHKGFYDDGDIFEKYSWPEQQYLTVRYSGKWTSIGFEYASWCYKTNSSLGIHYALDPIPWLVNNKKDTCAKKFYEVMNWGLKEYPQLKGKILQRI